MLAPGWATSPDPSVAQGKHFSEYILEGIMLAGGAASGDSASSIAKVTEAALDSIVKSARVANEDDRPDPYYTMRLDNLFLSATVAARPGGIFKSDF